VLLRPQIRLKASFVQGTVTQTHPDVWRLQVVVRGIDLTPYRGKRRSPYTAHGDLTGPRSMINLDQLKETGSR
jgi:hypothetical protein